MSMLGNNLLAQYYAQNANPYKQYEDYDIAVEIQTTPEQLEWGIRLRKNTGTLTINWGDGSPEETVSVINATIVTHVYPSSSKYIMYIDDATGINAAYSRIGDLTTYSAMVTRLISWKISHANFVKCENMTIHHNELWDGTISFSLQYCRKAMINVVPIGVVSLNADVFVYCEKIKDITFLGTPTSMDSRAFRLSSLETIRVPWSEGEVANAPWGASSTAQIIYNYTP